MISIFQLCSIFGLLIGTLECFSVLHTLFWISQNPRCLLKGGTAKYLTREDIVDGKLFSACFSPLIWTNVLLWIAVQLNFMYTSQSTQPHSAEKSIHPDFILIWYAFETRDFSQIIWDPGFSNSSDFGNKMDYEITQALRMILYCKFIPWDFSSSNVSSASKALGGAPKRRGIEEKIYCPAGLKIVLFPTYMFCSMWCDRYPGGEDTIYQSIVWAQYLFLLYVLY